MLDIKTTCSVVLVLFICPSFQVSMVAYAKPSELKKDLNEQFREKFPNLNITLTKLRRYMVLRSSSPTTILEEKNWDFNLVFIPQCHYPRRRQATFPYPTPHLTLPLHLNSPSLISVTVICQCKSLQHSPQNSSLSVDNDYNLYEHFVPL